MAISAKSSLKETIADSQASVKQAAERLGKTFSFVPDSKLKWSPSKSARDSLSIMAHCCLANQMFVKVFRGDPMPAMPTLKEIHELSRKFEATIRSRAQAVRLLKATTKEVIAALGTMTPKRFATSPNSPMGPMPMSFWVKVPSMHMSNHASQIDYLQTIWGDIVDHA